MGNRAHVFFSKEKHSPGVYLHWNGGPESVLAFLRVMRDRGWTRMDYDYASARFAAVAVEFFDLEGDCEGLSVGLYPYSGKVKDYVFNDNGVYFVTFENGQFSVEQHLAWNDRLKPIQFTTNGAMPTPYIGSMYAIERALHQNREKRRINKKTIAV